MNIFAQLYVPPQHMLLDCQVPDRIEDHGMQYAHGDVMYDWDNASASLQQHLANCQHISSSLALPRCLDPLCGAW